MTTDKDSVAHMKEIQFKDKVDALNRDFIKHLQKWYDQCHHSDFSAPIKSYKQHMKSLETTFSIRRENIADSDCLTETMVCTPGAGRKIVKAKRRMENKETNKNEGTLSVSTPVNQPPRMSFGNVSAITVNETPISASTTIVENRTSAVASGGRKRAIRGGGPLGGSESVVFRGSDKQTCSDNKSLAPVVNVPKFTPGFWGKKSDSTDNSFAFGKTSVTSGVPLSQKANEEEKDSSGDIASSTASSNSVTVKPLAFSFGNSNMSKTTSSSFPAFGLTDSKSAPGQKTRSPGEITISKPTPTLSFPSFGSSSGAAPFTFGSLPKSSDEKKDGDTEDDAEYVPPKADVVQNEEPDATFSTKCSVFKMVEKEYTKLGVGMLHLKETDGKYSLLIRAATATGTVWLNALINKSMKAVKADDKGEKMRIMCPVSATEVATFLIRFPNSATLEKVMNNIESNS